MVAMTIVSMTPEAGPMTASFTVAELSATCRMTRASTRRAIDALVRCGFMSAETEIGRTGMTTVSIIAAGHLIAEQNRSVGVNSGTRPAILTEHGRPFDSGQTGHLISSTKSSELVENSLADLGDLGHLKPPDPAISDSTLRLNASNLPFSSRARDQDLLRSSQKDLIRSSDLEILTRSIGPEFQTPYTPVNQESPSPMDDQHELFAAPTKPEKVNGLHDSDSEPKPKPRATGKRKRTDPANIPERAWRAADYLRAQVLGKNAAAVAGAKPWDAGWVWEGREAKRVGDGSRNGLRLSWANSFRLFAGLLKQALANGGKPSTDDHTWDEIAKTVHWLFHGQPTGVNFVVESPDTLRDKWDRIQDCRASSQRKSARPSYAGPAMIRPAYHEDDDLPAGVVARTAK